MNYIDENLISVQNLHLNKTEKKEFLNYRYKEIRAFTEKLCEPLETEDYVIQSMPDASPVRWNLAHVSWFFETFVLKEFVPDYQPKHPMYAYLFNSYYVQAGDRWTRNLRGALSRPTVKEVYQYRKYVDDHIINFLENADDKNLGKINVVMEIGFNHEQQHQELLLTDIKNVLAINPLRPVYKIKETFLSNDISAQGWIEFDETIAEIGHNGKGFFFDNELPRHKQLIHPLKLRTD